MSSREDILQSIRRATHVKYEKPDLKPLEDKFEKMAREAVFKKLEI